MTRPFRIGLFRPSSTAPIVEYAFPTRETQLAKLTAVLTNNPAATIRCDKRRNADDGNDTIVIEVVL